MLVTTVTAKLAAQHLQILSLETYALLENTALKEVPLLKIALKQHISVTMVLNQPQNAVTVFLDSIVRELVTQLRLENVQMATIVH